MTNTVRNLPPTRASTVIVFSGVGTPMGPQKWVECSGSIMHLKTSRRGASKVRVKCRTCSFMVISIRGFLQREKVLVEFVEALRPDSAVLLDPVGGDIEGLPLQMARSN